MLITDAGIDGYEEKLKAEYKKALEEKYNSQKTVGVPTQTTRNGVTYSEKWPDDYKKEDIKNALMAEIIFEQTKDDPSLDRVEHLKFYYMAIESFDGTFTDDEIKKRIIDLRYLYGVHETPTKEQLKKLKSPKMAADFINNFPPKISFSKKICNGLDKASRSGKTTGLTGSFVIFQKPNDENWEKRQLKIFDKKDTNAQKMKYKTYLYYNTISDIVKGDYTDFENHVGVMEFEMQKEKMNDQQKQAFIDKKNAEMKKTMPPTSNGGDHTNCERYFKYKLDDNGKIVIVENVGDDGKNKALGKNGILVNKS